MNSEEIIEKIRKEIERRLEGIVTGLDYTAETELNGLLDFLDSLQEETPMEILAKKCPQEEIDPQIAQCVADHWWEMAGEETPTDLEEEMEMFGENWPYPASFDGYDKDWVDECVEACAIHFYNLGKNSK